MFVKEPPPPDHPLLKLPNVVFTPHLGASTVEAQVSVAREAAQLISDYLMRGAVGFAVNMAAVDRAELDEMRLYVDLARRLGLLLAQMSQGALKKAELLYRGEVAKRSTRLITAAFAAGLLESRLEENVNIVNAPLLAAERGIEIVEKTSSQKGDFSTLVKVDLHTDRKVYSAAGTLFGNQFLRLVQLGNYHLDAYMDGVMLLFHHRDVPGLIGYIGTIFGKQQINIAQMTVGRQAAGRRGHRRSQPRQPADGGSPPRGSRPRADFRGHGGQAAARRPVAAVVRVRSNPSPAPSPKRRGGARSRFGPLSSQGRGLGEGVGGGVTDRVRSRSLRSDRTSASCAARCRPPGPRSPATATPSGCSRIRERCTRR